MDFKIAVLAGDGIGPEISVQGVDVMTAVCEKFGHKVDYKYALCGAHAIDEVGDPFPEETYQICKDASPRERASVNEAFKDGSGGVDIQQASQAHPLGFRMGCQEGDGLGGQQVAGSLAGNSQHDADQTVFSVIARLADGRRSQFGELGADKTQREAGVSYGVLHAHVNSQGGFIPAAGKGQLVAALEKAGGRHNRLPVVYAGSVHLENRQARELFLGPYLKGRGVLVPKVVGHTAVFKDPVGNQGGEHVFSDLRRHGRVRLSFRLVGNGFYLKRGRHGRRLINQSFNGYARQYRSQVHHGLLHKRFKDLV